MTRSQSARLTLSGNEGHLSIDARTRADTALATLITRFGYTRESARDLVQGGSSRGAAVAESAPKVVRRTASLEGAAS